MELFLRMLPHLEKIFLLPRPYLSTLCFQFKMFTSSSMEIFLSECSAVDIIIQATIALYVVFFVWLASGSLFFFGSTSNLCSRVSLYHLPYSRYCSLSTEIVYTTSTCTTSVGVQVRKPRSSQMVASSP